MIKEETEWQKKKNVKNSKEQAFQHFQPMIRHAYARQRRSKKSVNDMIEHLRLKLKKSNRRFHFFQFLSAKHTKTGRFGRKTAADRADTIQALDTAEDMPLFFDPFQQMDTDLIQRDTLDGDFYYRVQEEMELAEKSDFERSKISQNDQDRMALNFASREDLLSEQAATYDYAAAHDATKAFEPDEPVDTSADPDTFELELSVVKPHRLYLEYTQTKTAMKKEKLGGSVDEKTVVLRILEKDAAFQALLAKERAKPDHSDYDPATDEDPKSTINQLIQSTSLAMEGVGHSFVRMIAYGKGRRLSRYSFGFWPLAKAVMGGATEGEVRNPDTDKDHTNVITKNYPLRYSDYLRAAARQSVAAAMQIKNVVVKRKAAFQQMTGTNSLTNYFIKCCTDENFLKEMVYQLQIS